MGLLWSVGIFGEGENYQFRNAPTSLIKVFDSKQIRWRRRRIHTYADPFLFVNGSDLYLLAEVQETGKAGYIHAWKTADLKQWTDLGAIVKEHHHVSYPFVFKDSISGNVYLLPETIGAKNICLYQFEQFPLKPGKKTELIKGNYADSNILFYNNTYFLSTVNLDTEKHELFFSDSLTGNWCKHPSPSNIDIAFARNGGGFFSLHGELYRAAQNISGRYGEGVGIFRVNELTKTSYAETLVTADFKPGINYSWQQKGRHHVSVAEFQNKTVLAIDGLQEDYVINKGLNLFYRII